MYWWVSYFTHFTSFSHCASLTIRFYILYSEQHSLLQADNFYKDWVSTFIYHNVCLFYTCTHINTLPYHKWQHLKFGMPGRRQDDIAVQERRKYQIFNQIRHIKILFFLLFIDPLFHLPKFYRSLEYRIEIAQGALLAWYVKVTIILCCLPIVSLTFPILYPTKTDADLKREFRREG